MAKRNGPPILAATSERRYLPGGDLPGAESAGLLMAVDVEECAASNFLCAVGPARYQIRRSRIGDEIDRP